MALSTRVSVVDVPVEQDKATIDVAAGLVFSGGRLLITQRHAGVHLGGLWEFPGGKREGGEDFESALRRELLEELGIEVEVVELVAAVRHSYSDKRVHVKFFKCCHTGSSPRAIGCQSFAWVSAGELARYQFPEADRQVLAELERRSGLWQWG